jgi:hypothetical protein
VLVVRGDQKVGINTLTPAAELDVDGDIMASGSITPSDRRLKKSVKTLENVLERLEKVRGVSFEWTDEARATRKHPEGSDIGVIAQELEAEFPQLVRKSGPEEMRAVDYSRLSAVLLQALKELRSEMKAKVGLLESELEELREQVKTR